MASRFTTAAVGLTVLAAVVAVSSAHTAPAAAQDATAATRARPAASSAPIPPIWTTVAQYRMNERTRPVLRDSSPNHLDGTIGAGVRLSGTFLRYPHVRPRTYRPGHPSWVDSSSLLEPLLSSFRVTWRFRVSPLARPVFAPNFMQKGQGWPTGGMFKFTNHDGRVGCLFRDGSRQAAVATATSFSDGEWHVATCARLLGADPRVVVRVDGRLLGVNHKYVGMISNDWPLAIGGNTRCNGNQGDHPQHCNYWQGDMSWLRVQTQLPVLPLPDVDHRTVPTG